MNHSFDLTGKRVLVTGSSRGIGAVLATGLVQAGAEVLLNGRDDDALDRVENEIEDLTGVSVRTVSFDVTDPAAVEAAVAELGRVDVLVNNAGMQHCTAKPATAVENWRGVLDTNLTSAFLVGRAVARGMVDRGCGKIVNVCSVQSSLARPGLAAYEASKDALTTLTQSMCAEWSLFGLTINGLALGYVATEATKVLVEDPAFDLWICSRTPAGRCAQREDMVGALVWLTAPASDFVNGQVIAVDGGLMTMT